MEFKFWVLVSLGLLGREAVPAAAAAVANPLLLNRKLLFATDCAGITFSPETEAEAAAAVKAAARAALLERLGITEDEAALLREAGI